MGKKPKVKCRTPSTPSGSTTTATPAATATDADASAGSESGPPPETVTATVTREPIDLWADHPGVPEEFLRNPDNTWKHPLNLTATTGNATPSVSASPARSDTAPTQPASEPAGRETGSAPSAGLLDFDKFKVDPQEIENQIRREVDRRYHQWTATNGESKRPTKRAIMKKVRKEFFP